LLAAKTRGEFWRKNLEPTDSETMAGQNEATSQLRKGGGYKGVRAPKREGDDFKGSPR